MKEFISQVDGKFYKKCKVVMLPAVQLTRGMICKMGDKLEIAENMSKHLFNSKCKPQHLYILSTEKIEIGDAFLGKVTNKPQICIDKNHEIILSKVENKRFKIIASTDLSLTIRQECPLCKYHGTSCYPEQCEDTRPYPRPSNDFLQAYCKQGGIDEVLVEVRQNDFTEFYKNKEVWTYPIKVAQDNTIIIRKIKESWNREEVETIAHKVLSFGMTVRQNQLRGYGSDKSASEQLDEWLKNNL